MIVVWSEAAAALEDYSAVANVILASFLPKTSHDDREICFLPSWLLLVENKEEKFLGNSGFVFGNISWAYLVKDLFRNGHSICPYPYSLWGGLK